MSLKKKNSTLKYIEIDKLSMSEMSILENNIPIEFETNPSINSEEVKENSETHSFDSWFDFLKNSDESKHEGTKMPKKIKNKALVIPEIEPIDNAIESIVFDFDMEEKHLNEIKSFSIANDEELNKLLNTYIKEQQSIKKSTSTRVIPAENRTQDTTQLSLNTPEIITESMAILHTHQGNYLKAISIYEKLIAKFPEKSAFFASQIEKIKKN